MDGGTSAEIYNVLWTRKVTQKQNKGWQDGTATFITSYSTNGINVKVVDEEGKDVTSGPVPKDHIPIEEDDEFVVRGVLIQIGSAVRGGGRSTVQTSAQQAAPQRQFQRAGLLRSAPGFKPPGRASAIERPTQQNFIYHDDPEVEEPRYPSEKSKKSADDLQKQPSPALRRYMVQHYRGELPQIPKRKQSSDEDNEEVSNTGFKPVRPSKSQNKLHTIAKSPKQSSNEDKPVKRSFDEIIAFLSVGLDEEEEKHEEKKVDEVYESEYSQETAESTQGAKWDPNAPDSSDEEILSIAQRNQIASNLESLKPPKPSKPPEVIKLIDRTPPPDSSDSEEEAETDSGTDSIVDCEPGTDDASKEKERNELLQYISITWGVTKAPDAIPLKFNSIADYKKAFLLALSGEISSHVNETFKIYTAARFAACTKAPTCKTKGHGQMSFGIDKRGGYYFRCQAPGCRSYTPIQPDAESRFKIVPGMRTSIIAFLRSKGIAAFEATYTRRQKQSTISIQSANDDDFSKDDVWLLLADGCTPVFGAAEGYGAAGGTKIFLQDFFSDITRIPMQVKVLAIRIYNAQTERAAILRLIDTPNDLPLFPALLGHGESVPYLESDRALAIAADTAAEFKLNKPQTDALLKAAEFFTNGAPILLVHGIFGAGKSMLLAVIAIFLDRVLTEIGSDDKILIAATTNVAVDNVLSNLLKMGFESITRVGSVRRVRRTMLPYMTGHSDKDALNDLVSLKREEASSADVVDAALRNAAAEKESKVSRIDKVRVTGVTLAATSFAVMQGRRFPIVLLDECSQQPEPVSFLGLSFGAARVVCCGDPMQLPPTVHRPSPMGFGRPLFNRLSTVYPPVVLNVQYRCHPSIAGICSRLFYRSRLEHGVSEEDRSPLLGLPTILLYDVQCGREKFVHSSYENTNEAAVVCAIVRRLMARGVDQNEIGIIAFYKAQVDSIVRIFGDPKHPPVDVSTVDAFQGDERDFIIMTTTRTVRSAFVESNERVNVAVSRAKRHLIVVSNISALKTGDIWSHVFQVAGKKENRVVEVSEAPSIDYDPFAKL